MSRMEIFALIFLSSSTTLYSMGSDSMLVSLRKSKNKGVVLLLGLKFRRFEVWLVEV
jgi:hypothetical protein